MGNINPSNGPYQNAKGDLVGGTGAGLQPAVRSVGTDGQFLQASSGQTTGLIWATAPFGVVNTQTFTGSGTYTPTAGMRYAMIEILGGGGAGGGADITGVDAQSYGSGGGGGEYARGLFSNITIGSSQVITIGAGGTGVAGTTGNSGTTTSVGSLITAFGGSGGIVATSGNIAGAAGGTGGSGGDFRSPGHYGGNATNRVGQSIGANSQYGTGGQGVVATAAGNNGLGYGAGGSGAFHGQNKIIQDVGGSGSSGLVYITEYGVAGGGGGQIVQRLYTSNSGRSFTVANFIPSNNVAVTYGTGTTTLSIAITPKSASNYIYISGYIYGKSGIGASGTVTNAFIGRSDVTNYLMIMPDTGTAAGSNATPKPFELYMLANTTSPITIVVDLTSFNGAGAPTWYESATSFTGAPSYTGGSAQSINWLQVEEVSFP